RNYRGTEDTEKTEETESRGQDDAAGNNSFFCLLCASVVPRLRRERAVLPARSRLLLRPPQAHPRGDRLPAVGADVLVGGHRREEAQARAPLLEPHSVRVRPARLAHRLAAAVVLAVVPRAAGAVRRARPDLRQPAQPGGERGGQGADQAPPLAARRA